MRSTIISQFWSGGAGALLHSTHGTKDVMMRAISPETPVKIFAMSTRHQHDGWHKQEKLTYVGSYTTYGARLHTFEPQVLACFGDVKRA